MTRITKHFILLSLVLIAYTTNAQKALQYEKGASLNTIKFYIGDEIRFRLTESDIWYTRIIYDIDLESNSILIENTKDNNPVLIPIKDISHIKIKNRNKLGRIVGQTLFTGGLNVILGSVALSRQDIIPPLSQDLTPIATGAAGAGIGFLLWKLFSKEGVKLNSRKRLRLIDTTLYIPST